MIEWKESKVFELYIGEEFLYFIQEVVTWTIKRLKNLVQRVSKRLKNLVQRVSLILEMCVLVMERV